ncbi:hypothetical protein [Hazenella coriacea]|uniref:hypothetical protein n=1 Tax=Hazenella coriacea TaxID=1179467 RepID=UPI001049F93C|nr:hypothetical protein [Hazenella coriacea]
MSLIFALLLISFGLSGCSSVETETSAEEVNGETPDQIVIRYATAEIQNNTVRKLSFLVPKVKEKKIESLKKEGEFLDQFGPENNKQLNEQYRLSEVRYSETEFIYELVNAEGKNDKSYYMVSKTADGWKLEGIGRGDYEYYVLFTKKDLEPVILKDFEDDPVYQDRLEEDYDTDKETGDQARDKHKAYHSPVQEKINGKIPLDIAVEALDAELNENYKGLSSLITDNYKKYITDQNAGNLFRGDIDWNSSGGESKYYDILKSRAEKELEIEEAQKSEDSYIYQISQGRVSIVTVRKTKEGWKVDVTTEEDRKKFAYVPGEESKMKKILYY